MEGYVSIEEHRALEARVTELEKLLAPKALKKHVLTLLKDVSTDQLQEMNEDEFADEDEKVVEEVTEVIR